jgi:hypothetical protein
MEERLLEWCENWREHPSFPYILRHYAEHLYEKCPMTNERMTNEQMTNDAELCRLALDPISNKPKPNTFPTNLTCL